MADEKQNGGTPEAQELKIPAGDRFLFVRMGQDGQFQVLYSDPFAGIALLTMADEFIRGEIAKNFGGRPQVPQIAVPGLDLGNVRRAIEARNKKFGNG